MRTLCEPSPTVSLWDQLATQERQLSLPAALPLTNGELHCERLLRLVPGKRAVVAARFNQRPVLAKLFAPAAARQAGREREGHRRLARAGAATPALLHDEQLASGATVMLYEWLEGAAPAVDMERPPSPTGIRRLLDVVAKLYGAGLYQSDLHGNNFLMSGGGVWIIDAAGIEGAAGAPLGAAQVADNLALLIAQFRRVDQPAAQALVESHGVMTTFGIDSAALAAAVERRWQRRKREFLAKCFRPTTAIAFEQSFGRVVAWRRSLTSAELMAVLADPDAAIRRGELLKDGNSATVARLDIDGRPVVIKRYNIKSFGHRMRRFWRPSRAWVSWANAHRLALLGIDTPPPVGFVEQRFGRFRGRAYYLSEFVPGEELLGLFQRREPTRLEVSALQAYFDVAKRERLVHGDLKATNLFAAHERIWFLDLDAMREVRAHRRWRRLFEKDTARFTRNWTDKPWLARLRNESAAQDVRKGLG